MTTRAIVTPHMASPLTLRRAVAPLTFDPSGSNLYMSENVFGLTRRHVSSGISEQTSSVDRTDCTTDHTAGRRLPFTGVHYVLAGRETTRAIVTPHMASPLTLRGAVAPLTHDPSGSNLYMSCLLYTSDAADEP